MDMVQHGFDSGKVCRVCGAWKLLDACVGARDCVGGRCHAWKQCKKDRCRRSAANDRKENPDTRAGRSIRRNDAIKAYDRGRYREVRRAALHVYGGTCAWCGESHTACVTIDHMHNDGHSHRSNVRRLSGSHMYRWLKKTEYPSEPYQVLCSNGTCSKHHDPEGHRAAHPRAADSEKPRRLRTGTGGTGA